MTKRSTSRLTWSAEALLAFQELKTRFTSAPILHHPDPSIPFVVEVDAFNTGIGAVLSQRQGDPAKMFPCAFYSRKLSSAERNYDVGNCELLAMKAAIEEWRQWLEGAEHPFTVLEYSQVRFKPSPFQAKSVLSQVRSMPSPFHAKSVPSQVCLDYVWMFGFHLVNKLHLGSHYARLQWTHYRKHNL